MSTPYHPAINRLVETAVRSFNGGVKDVHTKLARFLFSYQLAPQSTTGVLPAELLMGRRLRSDLHLVKPELNKRVEREEERQKAACDPYTLICSFKV